MLRAKKRMVSIPKIMIFVNRSILQIQFYNKRESPTIDLNDGGDFFMKSISYPQFRIVEADTAQELTETLNRIVMDLKECKPEVTFDGLTARIAYTVTERDIPEDLSDEYHAVGVRLLCEDCPYFKPLTKRDGTEDHRKSFGTCPFQNDGIAHRKMHACETLFKMLNAGEVKLCLAK